MVPKLNSSQQKSHQPKLFLLSASNWSGKKSQTFEFSIENRNSFLHCTATVKVFFQWQSYLFPFTTTGSSMAKFHKVIPCSNKFWWTLKLGVAFVLETYWKSLQFLKFKKTLLLYWFTLWHVAMDDPVRMRDGSNFD